MSLLYRSISLQRYHAYYTLCIHHRAPEFEAQSHTLLQHRRGTGIVDSQTHGIVQREGGTERAIGAEGERRVVGTDRQGPQSPDLTGTTAASPRPQTMPIGRTRKSNAGRSSPTRWKLGVAFDDMEEYFL